MRKLAVVHSTYPLQLQKTKDCCATFEEFINVANYPGSHDYFNATPKGIYLKHLGGEFNIYVGDRRADHCPFCGEKIQIFAV